MNGNGNLKTVELKRVIGEIQRISVSLICPECGHEWGVKITDIREITEENKGDKFVCLNCRFPKPY